MKALCNGRHVEGLSQEGMAHEALSWIVFLATVLGTATRSERSGDYGELSPALWRTKPSTLGSAFRQAF